MNLFINTYTDKDPIRDAELKKCLEINKLTGWGICELQGRPTFKDFFNAINEVTENDDINIIANSDIYFDKDYDFCREIQYNECFALSRWDVQPNGSAVHYQNSGSQDTWIFRGAIRMVEGANFTQGVAGCDNKIAWCLEQAGYIVTNPSTKIKTYHLHLSGVRNYIRKGKPVYRLPRPRINVPII